MARPIPRWLILVVSLAWITFGFAMALAALAGW